jgi:hypothetical protein
MEQWWNNDYQGKTEGTGLLNAILFTNLAWTF